MEHFRLRHKGNDILKLVVHGARVAATPDLAIDARGHAQIVRIADLICGHNLWTEDVTGVKVFALGRSHLSRLGERGQKVSGLGATL
jgi:hypothetical protein